MKMPALLMFVLGIAISFSGCSSHEVQLRLPDAKMLSQSELENLFHAERTVEFPILDQVAIVDYYPDGRQVIHWDDGTDTGTFRIKNDWFCSTWSMLRDGEESCSRIYKMSETEYEFVGSDGTSAAIMRLK